jgi:predicted deacetylase
MKTDRREIAVTIHDVEPATFERVALIRDWLDDHGIGRATLLVVPAPDLHPFHDRSDELVEWLADRRAQGDAIAQHGLRDRCGRPPGWTARAPLRRPCRPDDEFCNLDGDETRRAVDAGWRILRLAGLEPQGFVAPAYAYTGALHQVLGRRFRWWAGLTRMYRPGGPPHGIPISPVVALGAVHRSAPFSGARLQARALASGRVLRLDLAPGDLSRPRRVAAVERVLEGARGRVPVTLDQLAAGCTPAAAPAVLAA